MAGNHPSIRPFPSAHSWPSALDSQSERAPQSVDVTKQWPRLIIALSRFTSKVLCQQSIVCLVCLLKLSDCDLRMLLSRMSNFMSHASSPCRTQTALHWAAKHGDKDMATLVANAGADVNTKSVSVFLDLQVFPVSEGDFLTLSLKRISTVVKVLRHPGHEAHEMFVGSSRIGGTPL